MKKLRPHNLLQFLQGTQRKLDRFVEQIKQDGDEHIAVRFQVEAAKMHLRTAEEILHHQLKTKS